MKLEYIGHATFAIDLEDGRRLVIDPYRGMSFDGRFNYPPFHSHCDFALLTHEHLDHNWLGDLQGTPVVVRQAWHDAGLNVRSLFAWHDQYQGTKFHGYVLMKIIESEGLRLAHLGDVGELLSDVSLAAFGPLDVLIIPVGGFYTIDGDEAARITRALHARVTIPCHYKTPLCSLPIEGPERFLSHFDLVHNAQGPVDVHNLPSGILQLAPRFGASRPHIHTKN